MKLGLSIGYSKAHLDIPVKLIQRAEELGYDSVWSAEAYGSDAVTPLAYLAALTQRIRLGTGIMQIAAHKCFHRKQLQQRVELSDPHAELLERSTPSVAMEILRQAEEEQSLRQAMSELPPRCRQLVHMLFFDEPARPYQEIAAELGIAVGSIGFIRQRCLERLRKRLLETGFS